MTLIDKAEALLPCPFCGGEASHNGGGESVFGRMWWTVGCKTCDIWFNDPEVWSKTDHGMLDPAYPPKHCFTAWNRRALPARGVGAPTDPRPANCRFRLKDDGKPYGRSSCSACDRSVFTGLGNSCHLAALDPTDAVHVNETPKSEHDADNVLTDAAQAREAAAWQSTTEAFIPFVTDERYRRFSPEVQKHYIPYRCPSCVDAAQARETALKKAAQLAYEVWDDPEALAKAILALIGEERT